MEGKRKITIQAVFRRFLISFCAWTGGLFLLCACLFLGVGETGIVYPANYGENLLEENRSQIQAVEKVTDALIPETCRYGVYQTDGTFLYGDLKGRDRTIVWNAYEEGRSSVQNRGFLKSFSREGEVCLVVYPLKAQFVNPVLRAYLPGVVESMFLLFMILFFLTAVWLVRKFGADFCRELELVRQVTEQVRLQNLDFERPGSKVKELDEIIDSLSQMRDALSDSLKQQWESEENRRQQVRALVHDIKTPLTIIQGSTQLLDEAASKEECREYESCILKETETIRQYIGTLQEMLKAEGDMQVKEEPIEIREFADSFISRAKSMVTVKNQKLEVELSLHFDYIRSDRQLLARAWENLLNNAVEYTPAGGEIFVQIEEEEDLLCFQVEDSGPGFTEEDLRYAARQFYQGDKSRNAKQHYGMGLFIAQSFAREQGGDLTLGQSKVRKGACVRMTIKSRKTQENQE